MAKIPFIPYDSELAEIFTACGITLDFATYGNQQGWDPTAFENAVNEAIDVIYSDDVVTEQEDGWLTLLYGDFTLLYWSTEHLDPVY